MEQLLTFGSPLGFPTIQRHLQPGWTRVDGFPSPSVGRWSNVFDPGDPVTIADRGLAEDFLRDGESAIRDREQSNEGLNRHEALDYLKGDELRDALRNALR